MKILFPSFIFLILLNSSCHLNEKKVDTYDNLKKDLKDIELEKMTPHADADEFEAEVNNGGLNQYFFNSSGQNCFETLRYFKKSGNTKNASILEKAINLINPKKLSETELIENLRKRVVTELEDSIVNSKLEELDNEFYK
jgi:Domain of unknown function (DUF4375)